MLESVKNFVHRGVGGVHSPLGSPSWADPPADTPLEMATAADSTHPTGMHSC